MACYISLSAIYIQVRTLGRAQLVSGVILTACGPLRFMYRDHLIL